MNHLLIILDSVSYEIFDQAKARNIRKLGEVQEAWTPGCWTLPTAISLLHTPYYLGKPVVSMGQYTTHTWLPKVMQNAGFETTLITDNPWFDLCGKFMNRGFDNYITYKSIDMKQLLKTASKYLKPKFFTIIWSLSTHHHDACAGSDVVKCTPYTKQWQIKAIDMVDKKLGRFFKKITDNTEIVVTSDHGDSYSGDRLLGHHPTLVKGFDERLFKVFLVRKKLLNTTPVNSTL